MNYYYSERMGGSSDARTGVKNKLIIEPAKNVNAHEFIISR